MSLLKYIQGKQKGKEAHRLEKEAMRDPFLADALEGYSKTDGDHLKAIEELQKRIAGKNSHKKHLAWTWGVAASLLISGFVGGYYLLTPDSSLTQMIAYETDQINEEMDVDQHIFYREELPSVVADTLPLSSSSREIIAQAQERVTPPAPPLPVTPVGTEILIIIEEEAEISEDMDLTEPVEAEMLQLPIKEMVIEERKETPEETYPKELIVSVENKAYSSGNVRGKIVDTSGEPMVGVAVVIEGTNRGTLTDINGNFALDVSPDETLSVRYIGYESLTLPVNTGKDMMIAMNETTGTLDEAVVVGYGTSKKQSFTSSSTPEPTVGNKAYKEYLRNNRRYPEEGECKKTKGKVSLSFYVNDQGRPYNIYVEEGVCPSLDKEAIRLVEEGPDWTTGSEKVKLEVKF